MAPAPRPGRFAGWRARVFGGVALAAAFMLLAAVVAQVLWRALLPPPAPVVPVPLPDTLGPLFAVSPPFGSPGAAIGTAAKADAPPITALQGDLKLLGVFSGRDGAGQALFRIPDRGPVLVAIGQEISAGVKLAAVFPDRVRIADRGETRDILLRPAATVGTKAGSAPVLAAARGERAGCVAPAGFGGSVYRINAELLSGMAAQPESWKPALDAARSGLAVRDAGGFAVMLGLKAGDLLREANGIALTATDDVLNAVVKPLQANQAVRVRGARGGAELDFLLVNASACTSRGR
jgi:hypothetical protein